jgi:hypothetical protein
MKRVAASVGLGVLMAAACGDGEPPAPAPLPDLLQDIRDACVELAEVWCTSAEQCLPTTFATSYADHADCSARHAALCEGTRFGEGSTDSPAQVRACAAASGFPSPMTETDCREWLRWEATRKPPAECTTEGDLDDGSPCLVGTQCESKSCSLTGACGSCRAAGEIGDACHQDSDCRANLACVEGSCGKFSDNGGPCGIDARCEPHLTCVDGSCATRPAEGEPCQINGSDPLTGNPCAVWPQELVCNGGVCEPYVIRAAGEVCGFPPDDPTAPKQPVGICAHGSVCRGVTINNTMLAEQKCVPVVDDGGACSLIVGYGNVLLSYPFGTICRAPAVCAANQCGIPHTATCASPHPP